MELFEPLNPMLTIGLDLPFKRMSAVEPEMRDRDDMHLLGVAKAEIEIAHDAAFVAHIPDLGDTTLVRKTPFRTSLQGFPQRLGRKYTYGQCRPHSLHQRHRFFYVIDHHSKSQEPPKRSAAPVPTPMLMEGCNLFQRQLRANPGRSPSPLRLTGVGL